MEPHTEDVSTLKPEPQKTPGGIAYISRPGTGPTVVFLHGIGSNATSFLPILDHLPDHLNVVLWNAPGYENSDPVDDPWPEPKTYADALRRFLDDLGLSRAHIVGHSLGTLIAASFARYFPDRLQNLVLVSAAEGYGVPRNGALPDKVRARIDDLKRLGPAKFAKERAANLVHDPAAHASAVASVEHAMSKVNPAGYAQAVHLLASGALSSDLAHGTIRPAFIIGAKDRITPLEQTLAAARAWEAAHDSAAPIQVIHGAGHAVYLQTPAEFSKALVTALAGDETDAPGVALQHEET